MNFFRSTLERDGERCFVRLGDTWLPVRAPIDAARREGAPVIAGTGRDLDLDRAVREAEASGGGRMIARLVGGARAAEGQRLRLAIDVDQLHLFDPETELALD